MEKLLISLNVNQIDNLSKISESRLLFESVEYVFAFICIIIAILVMMIMPLVLSYTTIDNFFKMQKSSSIIESKKSFGDKETNTYLLKPYYDNYLKYFSRFLGCSFGFICWNLLSIIYIIVGFKDIKTGLREYFYFPFNVMNKLVSEDFRTALSDFSLNWTYMLLIIGISVSFLFLGKLIGTFRGKKWIREVNYGLVLENV